MWQARIQELRQGPSHDILSVRGMVRAISCTLSVAVAGVFWSGLPCSSLIWLNRGTSKRSKWAPFGNQNNPKVDASNAMTLRWILCALVAITRRVVVIVEQPTSSILTSMPHFLYLADVAGALWSRVQLCPSLNTPNKYIYVRIYQNPPITYKFPVNICFKTTFRTTDMLP